MISPGGIYSGTSLGTTVSRHRCWWHFCLRLCLFLQPSGSFLLDVILTWSPLPFPNECLATPSMWHPSPSDLQQQRNRKPCGTLLLLPMPMAHWGNTLEIDHTHLSSVGELCVQCSCILLQASRIFFRSPLYALLTIPAFFGPVELPPVSHFPFLLSLMRAPLALSRDPSLSLPYFSVAPFFLRAAQRYFFKSFQIIILHVELFFQLILWVRVLLH